MSNKYFPKISNKIDRTAFARKYWLVLVLAITVTGVNFSYSITMMFLTTFVLAYLSKGSRCK